MSFTFRAAHRLSIHVHSRLDAGMPHQFFLNCHWCSSIVQPGAIAMTERMPTDTVAQSSLLTCCPYVFLLNCVLVIWPARNRISEEPTLARRCRGFVSG